MKYLLIIAVSFFIVNPSFAAKSVKGTVPDLPPLQPAPSGISPNYSGNINYIGKPEEKESASTTEQQHNNLEPSVSTPQRHSRIFWLFGPESKDETVGGAVKNFSFLIFLLVVLGGGAYYFWREKKRQ
jgi:hypothetical protein